MNVNTCSLLSNSNNTFPCQEIMPRDLISLVATYLDQTGPLNELINELIKVLGTEEDISFVWENHARYLRIPTSLIESSDLNELIKLANQVMLLSNRIINVRECYYIPHMDFNTLETFRKAGPNQAEAAKRNLLGYCSQEGIGKDKNPTEAFLLFSQATAKQSLAEACCNLAVCYQRGIGVSQDKPKAVKLYQEAMKEGHPRATYLLANCYATGEGVEKDQAKEFKLLQEAARCRYPQAMAEIAHRELLTGICNRSLFEEAAHLGDAGALLSLGIFSGFSNEFAIPVDLRTSFNFIQEAADQNHFAALLTLGRIYQTGRVREDEEAETDFRTLSGFQINIEKAIGCYQSVMCAHLEQPPYLDLEVVAAQQDALNRLKALGAVRD